MSLVEQYMDPRVLKALDVETRTMIERQVKLGVKQVDVRLAAQRLEVATAELRATEKLLASGELLPQATLPNKKIPTRK